MTVSTAEPLARATRRLFSQPALPPSGREGHERGRNWETAHLVHTSWADVSRMHPSPRYSLVELKHLDGTHRELGTKSWP